MTQQTDRGAGWDRPALDRERLLDAAGGDDGLALELITMLADEADGLWGRILAACAAGDLAAVTEAAHSLKGSARVLGFVRLGDAAAALQEAAATGAAIAGPWAAVEAFIGDPAAAVQE